MSELTITLRVDRERLFNLVRGNRALQADLGDGLAALLQAPDEPTFREHVGEYGVRVVEAVDRSVPQEFLEGKSST